MNNTLTDKRYLGVGSKSIQEAVPAERTYELQFTGYVTDNLLYNELLNQQENTNQNIELTFTKDNGENISLKFKDYMVSANDFPMPDDKGAIEVATTVMPRNLVECKVKTHWILQGWLKMSSKYLKNLDIVKKTKEVKVKKPKKKKTSSKLK